MPMNKQTYFGIAFKVSHKPGVEETHKRRICKECYKEIKDTECSECGGKAIEKEYKKMSDPIALDVHNDKIRSHIGTPLWRLLNTKSCEGDWIAYYGFCGSDTEYQYTLTVHKDTEVYLEHYDQPRILEILNKVNDDYVLQVKNKIEKLGFKCAVEFVYMPYYD